MLSFFKSTSDTFILKLIILLWLFNHFSNQVFQYTASKRWCRGNIWLWLNCIMLHEVLSLMFKKRKISHGPFKNLTRISHIFLLLWAFPSQRLDEGEAWYIKVDGSSPSFDSSVTTWGGCYVVLTMCLNCYHLLMRLPSLLCLRGGQRRRATKQNPVSSFFLG